MLNKVKTWYPAHVWVIPAVKSEDVSLTSPERGFPACKATAPPRLHRQPLPAPLPTHQGGPMKEQSQAQSLLCVVKRLLCREGQGIWSLSKDEKSSSSSRVPHFSKVKTLLSALESGTALLPFYAFVLVPLTSHAQSKWKCLLKANGKK